MRKFIPMFEQFVFDNENKVNEAVVKDILDIDTIPSMSEQELKNLYQKYGYRYEIRKVGDRDIFAVYKLTPRARNRKEELYRNDLIKNGDDVNNKIVKYISNIVKDNNSLVTWKNDMKAKRGGAVSSHAGAAKEIRTELKKLFPNTKFSVKSESYSGGDSVDIRWTDGANYASVNDIAKKYQQGHFNGMEDIYEYDNEVPEGVINQVKYVMCHRDISPEIFNMILDIVKDTYSGEIDERMKGTIRSNLNHVDIPNGVTGVEITDFSSFYNDRNGKGLKFITAGNETVSDPKKEEDKGNTNEPASSEKIDMSEVQLIDYSALSVAVIGNTKPIKNILNDLGGKYNKFLKVNGETVPGWIFSYRKKAELEKLFN